MVVSYVETSGREVGLLLLRIGESDNYLRHFASSVYKQWPRRVEELCRANQVASRTVTNSGNG
jgi:hypothetical protein